MVGHENEVMDLEPIFISDLLEDLGEDADGLFPVEPEGTVIGPADQVVWILGLYDAQWTSHAMRDARSLPKGSDTSLATRNPRLFLELRREDLTMRFSVFPTKSLLRALRVLRERTMCI